LCVRIPIEQANHWLAVYKDSQEAWSLDELLLSQVGYVFG